MNPLVPTLIFGTTVLCFYLLAHFRESGKGGRLGILIRTSDRRTWDDAVREKQAELDYLKSRPPSS